MTCIKLITQYAVFTWLSNVWILQGHFVIKWNILIYILNYGVTKVATFLIKHNLPEHRPNSPECYPKMPPIYRDHKQAQTHCTVGTRQTDACCSPWRSDTLQTQTGCITLRTGHCRGKKYKMSTFRKKKKKNGFFTYVFIISLFILGYRKVDTFEYIESRDVYKVDFGRISGFHNLFIKPSSTNPSVPNSK